MTRRTATTDDLTRVVQSHCEQWELRPDGVPRHGFDAVLLPVRTSTGALAMLKVGAPGAETEHEHLVLRRWGGDGAVRLLRADPHQRALLLERLRQPRLDSLADVEACEVVAGLYRRLHVPALPQLRSLTSQVTVWADGFAALPRSAPLPRRLVEQAITLCREFATDASTDAVVVHGDLHYRTVLAADRASWLAVAPRPCNGDPHYELAPMLLHRWDELAGNVRALVRTRLYTLVDAAGLDDQRARDWVVVRVVRAATRMLNAGSHADDAALTRYVALAKAVQD